MSEPPLPRTKFPFYSPLFAVFPVLAVFSANLGLFTRGDLLRPMLVAFGMGVTVFLLMSAVARSFTRGAWMASLATVGAWLYGPVWGRALPQEWMGWAVVGALTAVGWIWPKQERIPTGLLNRFGIGLVLVSGLYIATKTLRPATAGPAQGAAKGMTPDIFYLQVDGYGRADQLARVMQFDNDKFLSDLRARGFTVASEANSNYCQTVLSLASALNLDEIQTLLPKGASDREELARLSDRPRVVRDLRAAGYDSIAVTTGFPGFTFEGFDLVLRPGERMSYFEATLLEMTPLRMSEGLGQSQFEQRQDALEFGFETLGSLAKRTAKPRFVFAHILAPHPPFVFNADGSRKPRGGPFGYWDGSDYMAHKGTPQSYRDGYVDQVQWLNTRLLELVDQIGDRAIVILQSDHGSKLGLHQQTLEKTDLREAFGILAAYRSPEALGIKIPEDARPTNAMRSVVSAITGASLAPLPPRSYYSPFDRPTEFVDVTNHVR